MTDIDRETIDKIHHVIEMKANSAANKVRMTQASATVSNIQNGQIYVHVDGNESYIDTPVQNNSASVRVGDRVSVTVHDGMAFIAGNFTAPATDDTRANEAYSHANEASNIAVSATQDAAKAQEAAVSATQDAAKAQEAADAAAKVAAYAKQGAADATEIAGAASEAAGKAKSSADAASTTASKAQSTADAASAQANATASHFWLDAAGQANVSTDAGTVETGHSVTIGAKGIIQRLAGKLMMSLTKTALSFYLGDAAKLAAQYTPDGMDVYAAGRLLSSFTGSGAVFYDGTSNSPTTANVTASFGSDGAIIGKKSGANVEVDSDSVSFMDGNACMGYISDSRLQINAGDFQKIAVGKYVTRVDSDGTFVLGM